MSEPFLTAHEVADLLAYLLKALEKTGRCLLLRPLAEAGCVNDGLVVARPELARLRSRRGESPVRDQQRSLFQGDRGDR